MATSKSLYPLLLKCRGVFLQCRPLSLQLLTQQKSDKGGGGGGAVATTKKRGAEAGTHVKPLGEKVKDTTKTASYLGIILLGVGVTGALFYAVFRELFSSKSPNNVYTRAVEKCLADHRVEDKLGLPIKAYGEETRRGRRQHVNSVAYVVDGRQRLRMKFYLQGTFNKGTVQLEMVENDSGNYEYRYMFLQVNDLLQNVIVLEDNRTKSSKSPGALTSEGILFE